MLCVTKGTSNNINSLKESKTILNIHIKKILFTFLIITLFSFTGDNSGFNNFCEKFSSEELDSCSKIINNYFELKESGQTRIEEYYKRFPELDTLISILSKLPCVDSCFYYFPKGFIEKTNPPKAIISIYKINLTDTTRFKLTATFYHPCRVGLTKLK